MVHQSGASMQERGGRGKQGKQGMTAKEKEEMWVDAREIVANSQVYLDGS